MPKALVTGAAGQLGRDVAAVFARSYEVIPLTRESGDISNEKQIREQITKHTPDIVINCAAYTDVDGAETNQDIAFRINADGAEHVAKACQGIGAWMIHISTDYVFDGSAKRPYIETDVTNPINVYGKSKLAGEERVAKALANHLIVRTAWVYGQFGKNFVKTMLKLGLTQLSQKETGANAQPLKVVNDQRGNPTWTVPLAEQLLSLASNDITGIVHATCEEETTWYEFARAIFAEAGLHVDVVPCLSVQFPRPANRPANSSLENRRLNEYTLNRMPSYRDALSAFIDQYKGTLLYV